MYKSALGRFPYPKTTVYLELLDSIGKVAFFYVSQDLATFNFISFNQSKGRAPPFQKKNFPPISARLCSAGSAANPKKTWDAADLVYLVVLVCKRTQKIDLPQLSSWFPVLSIFDC